MNKLEKFKNKAENLLDKLEEHIQTMPINGNNSENCQRTFLQQNLNEVSYVCYKWYNRRRFKTKRR